MTTTARTSVLVAGLGSIGRRHARLLAERADVDVLICDPMEKFLEETTADLGKPPRGTYAKYADALAAKPDMVFITTPNHLHVPMGMAAIDAGCDLLVEKPVSDTLEEARKLVEAARRAGRFMAVGYMLRFDMGLARLKSVIDSGGIGTPVGGRAMIGSYITLLNARSPDRASRPGSLVVDYTHEMDFIRWLFGPTDRVMAAGARLGDVELKPEPNVFQTIMMMKNGTLVQIHFDYVQFPQRRIFEVYGDRGTLSYDFMSGEIRHFRHGRDHKWESLDVPPMTQRWDDLFRLEHESILTRRAAGQAPMVSGADGLAALADAQAMLRAAAEGAIIAVEA